jgi:hypothetical protein
MRYQINLRGFEGQMIEVRPPGLLRGAKLYFNGEPAPRGANRGEMLLRRNDGKDVTVKFKGFFLDVPDLVVDEEVIQVVQPLKWYEWVWNCLPLLIVIRGEIIALIIAFVAISLNLGLFRNRVGWLEKYGFTGLVSVCALALSLALSFLLALLLN